MTAIMAPRIMRVVGERNEGRVSFNAVWTGLIPRVRTPNPTSVSA